MGKFTDNATPAKPVTRATGKKVLYIGPPMTFNALVPLFPMAELSRFEPRKEWDHLTPEIVQNALANIDAGHPDVVILNNPGLSFAHKGNQSPALQLGAELQTRGIKLLVFENQAPVCSMAPLAMTQATCVPDTALPRFVETLKSALGLKNQRPANSVV